MSDPAHTSLKPASRATRTGLDDQKRT